LALAVLKKKLGGNSLSGKRSVTGKTKALFATMSMLQNRQEAFKLA
jgi:hypothetical protein